MASSAQPCTTPEASHFVETRPTAATGSKSQYDVFISYRRDGGFETAVRTAAECGFTHTNILEHDRSGAIVWRQVPLDVFG